MELVLRRFVLQPNIRERNRVVKRDPTIFESALTCTMRCETLRF